jgi:hypothetical protein
MEPGLHKNAGKQDPTPPPQSGGWSPEQNEKLQISISGQINTPVLGPQLSNPG